MPAPLSLAIISSFQTVRHNSQTLSMNPSGLHVAGYNNPASPSSLVKFINKANLNKNMQTDENGGEYLDTRTWLPLAIHRKTDARGRVHAGEIYIDKDIRVFVSDVDQEPEPCKSYLLLPKSIFREIRKSRAKNQIGELLKVQNNGDVWTTQKHKYVKIFVRK